MLIGGIFECESDLEYYFKSQIEYYFGRCPNYETARRVC